MNRTLTWLSLGIVACLSLEASDPSHDPSRDTSPPPSPEFKRPPHALFADDFSSADLRGWSCDSTNGAWSVRNGMLRGELPDVKQAHSFLRAGDSTWTDYAVDLDVCGMRGVDKGIGVRVHKKTGLGVDLRGADYQDVVMYVGKFPVGGGKATNTSGAWSHMRVEIRGNSCRVVIDDHVAFDKHLRFHAPAHGGIVLAAYAGGIGQCTVYYDNVVVTALEAAPDP